MSFIKLTEWFVYISPIVISWIRNQPESFDNYDNSIQGVKKIAKLFSDYTITACGHGFLIFVENEDVALRCTFFEDKKQIHISHIIS